jgi:hypothetical protein
MSIKRIGDIDKAIRKEMCFLDTKNGRIGIFLKTADGQNLTKTKMFVIEKTMYLSL